MRVTTACIIALLLPLGPSAAAPPPGGPAVKTQIVPKTCEDRGPHLATSGQVRLFRNPREFQPADLHHAVVRRDDNCVVPAIVRRNVGR